MRYYWSALVRDTGEIMEYGKGYPSTERALHGFRSFVEKYRSPDPSGTKYLIRIFDSPPDREIGNWGSDWILTEEEYTKHGKSR